METIAGLIILVAIIGGVYYILHKLNPTKTQAVIDEAKTAVQDEVKKVL